MIFGNVVIDETFGLVQNEPSMDKTTSREFSFTAPVSGFYRFQVNLQQITQVGFQDFYIASCSHRPIVYLWAIDYVPHSLWVIALILWTHIVKINLKKPSKSTTYSYQYINIGFLVNGENVYPWQEYTYTSPSYKSSFIKAGFRGPKTCSPFMR